MGVTLHPSLERVPLPSPSRTPPLTFAGEAVGGDTRQGFAAHVAEGGAGVGAGVPVVHAREVLHVELRGLPGAGAQPFPISRLGPPGWHSLPPSPRVPSASRPAPALPAVRGCTGGRRSCPAAKGARLPRGASAQPPPHLTSWISHFCTDFRALIQSSISFLFSAHRMSFRNGVITCKSHNPCAPSQGWPAPGKPWHTTTSATSSSTRPRGGVPHGSVGRGGLRSLPVRC